MSAHTKLFLSAVTREFEPHRKLLAGDLKRPDLDVAVQEDFGVLGATTLEKLDDYLRNCDAVVHLVGKATGAVAEEPAVAALLAKYPDLGARLPGLAPALAHAQPGFSYTQWEAYLALYHGRPLFIYLPADFEHEAACDPRAAAFGFDAGEWEAQKRHYRRLAELGRDRGRFQNEERLSSAVLRDLVDILPRLESTVDVRPTRLRHGAERLFGRDDELTQLDAAWSDPHKHVVVIRAWGGVGKTSLVAAWLAELALKGWRGAERVYDWSFYSQGTREQGAASADAFIDHALRAFGDPDPGLGSPWERGARLAARVGRARTLLVLDGLEPLQHSPGPMQGQLKDPAVAALLKGLAAHNAGLCVVTTREKLDDIKPHYGHTADDVELSFLGEAAGAALLHHAGATRAGARAIGPDDAELRKASREVRGHGLTLQLVGQYLKLAVGGDILKRATVRLEEADHEYQHDATRPYGHAFKAMEAYERWFTGEGETGQRQLAILRLLGLFDRPASAACLGALLRPPVIAGLTEPLFSVENEEPGRPRVERPLEPRQLNIALTRLESVSLIVVHRDEAGGWVSIDAHPLLREYFGRWLRAKQPEAWKAAHRRVYEHLCATTKEGDAPTLEALQPLYQAVAHGCQAGLHEEARAKVYRDRILRGTGSGGFYSTRKLGAFGSDLGAVACFFETPWSRVSPALIDAAQAWLLNGAAIRLRALGRLTEALEPMRAVLCRDITQADWRNAVVSAGNLSELELTLGDVARAVADAEQSVTYADQSGDAFQRMSKRTTHADALHQAGRRAEAEALFREAERMQAERQPQYPLLYSQRGYGFCDLLLTEAERSACQALLGTSPREKSQASGFAVAERAAQTLEWARQARQSSLLTIALDHLTLGRAALYESALSAPQPRSLATPQTELDAAVDWLRRAGQQQHIPRGLLPRAWLRYLTGARTGPDSAQADLDEAWEIAERGPMPLFQADIHLHRARLFGRSTEATPYPWRSPHHDLAEARRLIEKHGYARRHEELQDAESALGPTAPNKPEAQ